MTGHVLPHVPSCRSSGITGTRRPTRCPRRRHRGVSPGSLRRTALEGERRDAFAEEVLQADQGYSSLRLPCHPCRGGAPQHAPALAARGARRRAGVEVLAAVPRRPPVALRCNRRLRGPAHRRVVASLLRWRERREQQLWHKGLLPDRAARAPGRAVRGLAASSARSLTRGRLGRPRARGGPSWGGGRGQPRVAGRGACCASYLVQPALEAVQGAHDAVTRRSEGAEAERGFRLFQVL
mmetsp:Transcript_7466/g.20233  ORF Transcript_7466/g.20233 Transcript_7466/m.20233 type:complete len:238 (+) Transcript_7466:88-801(+)